MIPWSDHLSLTRPGPAIYAQRFGSPATVIALRPDNPLIVQSDRTLLLEVAHPAFEQVRDELARFAELVKSPEHIHTYRITPLSLWNASASGVHCTDMIETLNTWSKYPVPQNLLQEIEDHGTRYGKLRLVAKGDRLALEMDDRGLFWELENQKSLQGLLAEPYPDEKGIFLNTGMRGEVKLQLIRLGHPVQDMAGYKPGDPLPFELSPTTLQNGKPFGLRPYQQAAVDVFHAGGGPDGGAGVHRVYLLPSWTRPSPNCPRSPRISTGNCACWPGRDCARAAAIRCSTPRRWCTSRSSSWSATPACPSRTGTISSSMPPA